jgi:hypothetical protein
MNPLGISVVRADESYGYAKYYYYEGPTVYIEVTSINSASGNKWRVRGRSSYNDSNVYLEGAGPGIFTFDSVDNYSYIFQIQNWNGDWVNSTNAYGSIEENSIINIDFASGGSDGGDSGSGSGGTATENYYIYIDQGAGTSLNVERTWSDNGHYTGTDGGGIMSNGEQVWYGTDVFVIDVTAIDGYSNATWQYQNLRQTTDGRYTMNYPGNIYITSYATGTSGGEGSGGVGSGGTNSFIKRNMYIGVNNIARKVRECYIGVSGVARRIKMAYIGVGGVARPVIADGDIVYYGEITPLEDSDSASGNGATSLASRALVFCKGSYAYMNVYTESLYTYRVEVPDGMCPYGSLRTATHVGDCAIFIGVDTSMNSIEVAYGISLEMQLLSQPSIKSVTESTHVGSYALFATNQNGCVSVYDKYLTKQPDLYKSNDEYGPVATHVGNYAIFAGGQYGSNGIDAYDSSLSRNGNIEPLTSGGRQSASYAGGSALFYTSSTNYLNGWMDAYNSSLEKITNIDPLGVVRAQMSTVHIGDYALFSGGVGTGRYSSSEVSSVTEIYDKELTRSDATPLTTKRKDHIGVPAGNFAIFVGGNDNNNMSIQSAEAYALI